MTSDTLKPGKHGTLHLFAIAYEDQFDSGNKGVMRTWAYDAEHAEEKFYDSDDADGWVVKKIARVRATLAANRKAGVPS